MSRQHIIGCYVIFIAFFVTVIPTVSHIVIILGCRFITRTAQIITTHSNEVLSIRPINSIRSVLKGLLYILIPFRFLVKPRVFFKWKKPLVYVVFSNVNLIIADVKEIWANISRSSQSNCLISFLYITNKICVVIFIMINYFVILSTPQRF